jgi:hypothetical protein
MVLYFHCSTFGELINQNPLVQELKHERFVALVDGLILNIKQYRILFHYFLNFLN